MTSRDASSLMREAQALKAQGRLEEAIRLYRQAVSANPGSGVAAHNLAAALGDAGRWSEAEPHVRSAFAAGLDAPETWLVLARCQQALGRLDKAEAAFRQALRRRPDMYDAHRELAQLVWMRTGDLPSALLDVESALRSAPNALGLQMVKAQALEFAGQPADAFALMSKLAAENPNVVGFLLYAAQLAVGLSKPVDGLAFAEHALRLAPDGLPVQVTLAEALLAAGEAQRASAVAGALLASAPTNQHAIALQATAWRLLGDPRYRELHDYDAFVSASFLDTPPGWSDLSAYVADVGAALRSLHAYREHPFNQSLRHGSQAINILQQPHPALQALPQALNAPIRQYLAALGRGADPLRSRNTGNYTFQGMWSVKLRPGGYHIDHVHPQGWLSSACYVETVPPNGKEGWIKFGQPGIRTQPSLEAERFVEPKPGMLVLFPSYMWHGTVPFSGDASRLTFAFDLVPAPGQAH